jgi:hypothetical protein
MRALGMMPIYDAPISLGRGRTMDIMESLKIEVADSYKRLTAPVMMVIKTGEERAVIDDKKEVS